FDNETGEGGDMDDNVRYPKTKKEAKEDVKLILKTVKETGQLFKSKEIVHTLSGKTNVLIKSNKADTLEIFGVGKDKPASYWT
ncbi:ATP-dependent DNA helicase RecQ, partial [Aquimarina celericrescens]|nr:ATP-dependent DNA helicase RecQ [Aquimarina celericrescens]